MNEKMTNSDVEHIKDHNRQRTKLVQSEKHAKTNTSLTIMRTPRLTLREPAKQDWEDIYDYMQHGSIQEYMPQTPKDYTKQDAKNKVSSLQELNAQDDAKAWVIEHNETTTVIGIIDEKLALQHRKARLGYHISPDYQRRGLMTEALQTVIQQGFNDNVHKFTAEIASQNHASRQFIESLGFKDEGTLRAELFIKGSFHDVHRYGLIEQEWDP